MTSRRPVSPSPEPLEAFASHFDDLLERRSQRASFRRYLEGLLLSQERNKTLTALANAEPIVGAHNPSVQMLQCFLSESNWKPAAINARRKELLFADPWTAPHVHGVLAIDETGDRKDGSKTAHVGRRRTPVSGQFGQDRQWSRLRLQPVRRRTDLLSAGSRALHAGFLVRQGQERSQVPYQAADRTGVGPTRGCRRYAVSCGGMRW